MRKVRCQTAPQTSRPLSTFLPRTQERRPPSSSSTSCTLNSSTDSLCSSLKTAPIYVSIINYIHCMVVQVKMNCKLSGFLERRNWGYMNTTWTTTIWFGFCIILSKCLVFVKLQTPLKQISKKPSIDKGSVIGSPLTLDRILIHYGSTPDQGSEHRINGKS